IYEDLVRRRLAERPLHLALELARVLDDGAALPTEREARAQDHGITGVLDDLARLFDGARVAGARALEPDARHRLLEEEAILRLADGIHLRADQLHAVLGQHAALVELEGEVQRRLPAERGEQGIGEI